MKRAASLAVLFFASCLPVWASPTTTTVTMYAYDAEIFVNSSGGLIDTCYGPSPCFNLSFAFGPVVSYVDQNEDCIGSGIPGAQCFSEGFGEGGVIDLSLLAGGQIYASYTGYWLNGAGYSQNADYDSFDGNFVLRGEGEAGPGSLNGTQGFFGPYEFNEGATLNFSLMPTPEAPTILLFVTGLAAVILRRSAAS